MNAVPTYEVLLTTYNGSCYNNLNNCSIQNKEEPLNQATPSRNTAPVPLRQPTLPPSLVWPFSKRTKTSKQGNYFPRQRRSLLLRCCQDVPFEKNIGKQHNAIAKGVCMPMAWGQGLLLVEKFAEPLLKACEEYKRRRWAFPRACLLRTKVSEGNCFELGVVSFEVEICSG
ncbi:hypothetical protein LSM04_006467 [Trypanosoma melophagium]|uniref:uncharacterized protein n=1 Tax=Trypanosoma melophagium TaxID=715481 RepID=UPI003519E1C7|nr:hypothetical protein LSM04_006467 [Trypanosoma melophagium]